jgi:hypothetical protein
MAGLGRKVFSPGEVLTATNVQNYLMDQAVQVYAGTAARGSAIGTATTEGMVSYLADSNVVQAYTGSSWDSLAYASSVPATSSIGLVTVVPSSVNNTGGTAIYNSTSGLVTFSGVTTVAPNGVFTSSYQNYEIILNLDSTSAGTDINLRVRAAGTDLTTSTYQYSKGSMLNATYGVDFQSSSTGINCGRSGGAGGNIITLKIGSPQQAQNTKVVGMFSQGASIWYGSVYGNVQNQVSYDGLSLTGMSATMTGTLQILAWND